MQEMLASNRCSFGPLKRNFVQAFLASWPSLAKQKGNCNFFLYIDCVSLLPHLLLASNSIEDVAPRSQVFL